MRFEWHELDRLSDDFLERWRELGDSACSPNVYLMPGFLMPALRHLDGGADARLAVLRDGDELLALGAFTLEQASVRFPFRRLTAVRSRHSFQSGLLLRAGAPGETMDVFLDGLLATGCRGIRFDELRADTRTHRALMAAARRRGMRWFVDRQYRRAALDRCGGEFWREHVSKSRHKRMTGSLRRLSRQGEVSFRVVAGDAVAEPSIEAFLRLESTGWKAPTSLRGRPGNEAFFRDVCRLARDALFFCELHLDGRVIASTTNFVVGDRGFAFKVGSDPDYTRYSPGLLVEYCALERLDCWPDALVEIDSGAQPDSYIDGFWPKRIPMVAGHLVSGRAATAFAGMKYAWKRRRSGGAGVNAGGAAGAPDGPSA